MEFGSFYMDVGVALVPLPSFIHSILNTIPTTPYAHDAPLLVEYVIIMTTPPIPINGILELILLLIRDRSSHHME